MKITFGDYTLYCVDVLPPEEQAAQYRTHAQLVEEYGDSSGGKKLYCITVRKGSDMPFLLITHHYARVEADAPEFLFIPETHLLFIGAENHAQAYKLDTPKKLWSHAVYDHFLGWVRQGEFILLTGSRQLAAWDIYGWKKWMIDVQPPWHYNIQKSIVYLTHGGQQHNFPLDIGPLELLEEE